MKLLATLITCATAMCMHLKTEAQFTWNFTNATAGGTVLNLTAGSVTRANNNTGSPTFLSAGSPVSTGYTGASGGNNGNCSANIGAINTATSTYTQVVITPAANFWVNISSIKWGNYSISTTGPATLSIYTSIDNYASPVATVASGTASTWNLLNPSFTPINGITGTALTIRIYASGGTAGSPGAGTANWRMDDLVITAAAQSGTSGQIPKYTGPATFANSIMTESNNNIGVGTTTPAYKLDVMGNLKTTQDANINGLVLGKGTNGLTYNTAFGTNALNVATGDYNTAIGYGVGSNITTGNQNTGVGYQSMVGAVGHGAVALGAFAMQNWVTGNFNIGIGYDALHGAGTGAGNVGIGRNVMGGTVTGNYNVGLGYLSINTITSGSSNIGIGYFAGNTLTTGSNNIFIGTSVTASSATVSNELNIGNWIYGSNGSIGVGVAAPATKLDVAGTIKSTGLLIPTNALAGNVLTSDANGNATWETPNLGSGGDGSETIVTAGTNVSVAGIGTIGDPYVISSTASGGDGSETIVTAGTNVGVTGTGTIADPYVISSTASSYWDNAPIGSGNIINNNAGGIIIGTGITTLPAGYKLYVSNGILAEKVKVALKSGINWADHVFAKDYTLKPLSEVEAFINLNNHLPGVPSAETLVKEGGIDVNQMFAKQMEKIEELTLYIIEMNKKLEKLEKENAALKSTSTIVNQ